MNAIKELKKRKLSSIQRIIDFILKTSFFILLFVLIAQITMENLPTMLQEEQEVLINFTYELALNESNLNELGLNETVLNETQWKDFVLNETKLDDLQLNETQKKELQSKLKSEIANRTSSVLTNITNSIKKQYKNNVPVLSQLSKNALITILLIILIIIFINSGLLLTSNFISNIILEVGFVLMLPFAVWKLITKTHFIENTLTAQFEFNIKIINKLVQIISSNIEAKLHELLLIAIILIVSGFVLKIAIRIIAQKKLQHLETTKSDNPKTS